MGLKATFQFISLVFALVDCVSLGFKVALQVNRTTGVDYGFVTDHGREEGLGCHVTHLISYPIVVT
jgi:hypothetical protein